MNMDNIKDSVFKFLKLENIVNSLTGYVESRVELVKIEIREDVARTLSHGLVYAALMLFAFLFLVFLSIGLAQYLNTLLSASYPGYLIISAVYGVAFLIFLLFRKNINNNFEKHFSEIIKRKEK
jgi:uncharacterized membrane protein YqjE